MLVTRVSIPGVRNFADGRRKHWVTKNHATVLVPGVAGAAKRSFRGEPHDSKSTFAADGGVKEVVRSQSLRLFVLDAMHLTYHFHSVHPVLYFDAASYYRPRK